MEILKNYRINSLFEFYWPLLTKKQNDYMRLYYVDDYSLGEISEEFNISRQAVYDNVRRTEAILEKYESQLHLYFNFVKRNHQIDQLRDYVQTNYHDDINLKQLIDNLSKTEEK